MRFLLGAGLGALVGSGALVLISQLAPLAPPRPANEPVPPALSAPQVEAPEALAPETRLPDMRDPAGLAPGAEAPPAPEAAAVPPVEAGDPPAAGLAPLAPSDAAPAPEGDAASTAPVSAPRTAPAPEAEAQPIVPEIPAAPPAGVVTDDPAALLAPGRGAAPLAPEATEPPSAPASLAPATALEAGEDAAPAGDVAEVLPALTPEEEALLAAVAREGLAALPEDLPVAVEPDVLPLEAEAEPAPEIAPERDAVPEASVAGDAGDARARRRPAPEGSVTLVPQTAAPDAMPVGNGAGVSTRLPRIGDAPATAPDPAAEGLPGLTLADDAALPARLRHARPFTNPEAKPRFAVVLIDDGAADLDRAALAALPFPVSFALDPLKAESTEHARIYRQAGQEVLMLATGLPQDGSASDLEMALGLMEAALPESVALLETPTRRFQNNRPWASLVVPGVNAHGRGLLTWDGGINAAQQVALREDVPSASIFRQLDAEGEAGPVVRRYLDRAAFKAAQEGRVIVAGSTRPETVAALLEWTLEGRAGTVALAPVSAVLETD